jgi:hypothetical protein
MLIGPFAAVEFAPLRAQACPASRSRQRPGDHPGRVRLLQAGVQTPLASKNMATGKEDAHLHGTRVRVW